MKLKPTTTLQCAQPRLLITVVLPVLELQEALQKALQ